MYEEIFSHLLSRRNVVKGMSGLTIAAGLAACGTNPAPTATTASTATPTQAPQPTATLNKAASAGPISTLFTYKGHTDVVNQVAWSPDSRYIASASDDGTAQIWNWQNGQTVLTYKGMNGQVKSLSWSPDGKRIVVAGDAVQVVDAASGKLILAFKQNNNVELSASWSPDGKYIACVGQDNRAYVWDAATGNVINSRIVGDPGSSATFIAWPISNTAGRIAAIASDGTVQAWDALTGGNVVTYKVSSVVNALAWIGDAGTPDASRLLVFGCADRSTQLWNAASASKQSSFVSAGSVLAVAAALSKSIYIASGINDGTVPVWRFATDSITCTYTGHTDSVITIAWSFTTGQQIASGGKDKTVQVWQPSLN